jgi:hypothetical protein
MVTSSNDMNKLKLHGAGFLKSYVTHLVKDALMDPILDQLNPVQKFTPYSFKTHFDITLASTSRSLKWLWVENKFRKN